VIAPVAFAWLAVGLLVLAEPARAQRVLAWRASGVGSWLLRGLGTAALVIGAWLLVPRCGNVLAVAGMLLVAMACASIAVLLVPLRPRLYAATVAAAGLVALAAVLWAQGPA
jgi:hypothetical protein